MRKLFAVLFLLFTLPLAAQQIVPAAGGGGVSTAADVANVPAGGIAATDVQAAINELDTEKGTAFTGGTVTNPIVAPSVTAGSLGANIVTQTCAGWGLAAPVGAWSCSGDVITRTASASDLTITNGGAAVVGTTYRVTVTVLGVTGGALTVGVGGVTGLPVYTSVAGTNGDTVTVVVTAKTTAGVSLTASAAGAYTIRASAVALPFATGLSTTHIDPYSVDAGSTIVRGYEMPPVGVMTATRSSGGALSAGVYNWKVTYLTASGETTGGASPATQTATLNQKCVLTVVPVGSANVVARNIYRTLVGGSTYYYVGQIADNTTATFTDTSSDATISANAVMPSTNTALDPVIVAGGSTYGSGTEFKTRVLLPAGTAAQPAIGWAADDDGAGSGIYRNATNSIGFLANGSEMFSVDAYYVWVKSGAFRGSQQLMSGFIPPIYARTSDAAEDGNAYQGVITNAGATSLVTRTLPTAAAGGNYTFTVFDADGLKIVAAAGDNIQLGPNVSVTAGYITSTTIGDTVTLVALDATTWLATGGSGTWSLDGTKTYTFNPSTLMSSSGVALGLTAQAPVATTGASQAGVGVSITASPAVASTDTAGAAAGGDVTITAGAAARNTSGNANGGNIVLTPGLGIGTGSHGMITIPSTAANVWNRTIRTDYDLSLNVNGSAGAGTVWILKYNALSVTNSTLAAATSIGEAGLPFAGAFLAKYTLGSSSKTLTDNSATIFAKVAVASGSTWGGEVIYKLEGKDATDFTVMEGKVKFSAINKGGTITCSTPVDSSTASLTSAGTSTLNGFTCADAGSNVLNLLVNYTTSLTDTTNWPKIYHRLDSPDTVTYAPQ